MYAQTLYVPCFHLWNGRGRPWPGTCASLLSAAINLTLAFALVAGHGLRGVAGAATAGHVVAAAFFLIWFHRSERMSLSVTLINEVVPPLAAMTASAGLCEFVLESMPRTWPAFLAASGGSVVLYVVLLLLMGHVSGRELADELRLHAGSRPLAEPGQAPPAAPAADAPPPDAAPSPTD
jgi:O-antigen/teichoic acid export membrane protein